MNPFTAVMNNTAVDRHFGGSDPNIAADPYISGYHYIQFVRVPTKLIEWIKAGDGGTPYELTDEAKVRQFLQGACLSVTPPGGTLNKTEFTGIGGIKWAVPTNIDYTNVLTVKFLEFSSLPVLNIISGWVRLIRDMKTGTTALNDSAIAYTKADYTGSMFYWTTKPDGKTVEYSACYTGMFPTKDPQDLYSGDLTAVDKLEVDIEFNVDWIWHEQWVHTKCQEFADAISANTKPDGGYRGGLTTPGAGTDDSVTK